MPDWLNAWKRAGITASRVALVVAGAAAAFVLLVLILLRLPPWLVDQAHGRLADTDRVKAITEERRTVLAVFAAIGAAITLWYTHQRQELDRDANRTDRYTRAVDQLGDDAKPAVQLGGVYALERVARDSIRDRRVSFDVLSAFIRQQAKSAHGNGIPEQPGSTVAPVRGSAGQPSEPVLAALSVHARRPPDDDTFPGLDLHGIIWKGVDLSGLDLTGANLTSADLRGADLTLADLTGADLTGADLTNAYLAHTNLTRAKLIAARLTHAYLGHANLTGANLTGASLFAADLTQASLTRADLNHADLADVRLNRVELIGAVLFGATLRNADLTGANLTGAHLTNANLTDANLTGANLTRADLTGAILPQGWQAPGPPHP